MTAPPGIVVRRFRMVDLARVVDIEKSSFGADAWPAALFREYFAECGGLFLVVLAGRRIAGYSITCVEGTNAEVASIAVAPRYRGRGAAAALLGETLRCVRKPGVKSIWLMVRVENPEALRLYRRFGFRSVRLVAGYYEDGGTGRRMRLKVG